MTLRVKRLREALQRDANDGQAWYLLGACQLRLGDDAEAVRCGYQASRFPETVAAGFDLAGRGHMRRGEFGQAVEAFEKAVRADGRNPRAKDHLTLALLARGDRAAAVRHARRRIEQNPTDLVAMAVAALAEEKMEPIARQAREVAGEDDFVMTDVSLALADLGMFDEAARWLQATCVDAVPAATAQSADAVPPGVLPIAQAAIRRRRSVISARPPRPTTITCSPRARRPSTCSGLPSSETPATLGHASNWATYWPTSIDWTRRWTSGGRRSSGTRR